MNPIFFPLLMGRDCCLAVLSIRRRGEFSGPVIVLTDAPLERYTGVFDENVVVMNHVRKHLKLNYFKYGEILLSRMSLAFHLF